MTRSTSTTRPGPRSPASNSAPRPRSAPFGTFDNTAALGVGATTDPTLTTLSTVGTNEAFSADGGTEIGSPGTAPVKSPLAVTEVAPWGSSWPEYKADWFELTNESPVAVSLTGWKMDDSSNAFATAVALNGVSSIAPGESVLFVETRRTPDRGQEEEAKSPPFETSWFGSSVPGGLQVGTYNGAGVGLSGGGDGVNIFDSEGDRITGVSFGANEGTETGSVLTAAASFENAAGLGSYKAPVTITTLSVEGVNGAVVAHDQIGSPGATETPAPPALPDVKITEVDPTGSSGAATRPTGSSSPTWAPNAVDLTGWKMDDNSNALRRRRRRWKASPRSRRANRRSSSKPSAETRRLRRRPGSRAASRPACRSAPTTAPASASAPAATR